MNGTYRGRLLLYLNDRGTLNLINELSLEDYLRGVVPREMGPRIFDEIEALKAQAVAARTYAVKNLGEFLTEGYDICGTPRCQVYGGMEVEDPLTDRAIRETAGEVVLWEDAPIDALYSSTCGGHTEDVELVFPLKSEPYLRAVPCFEGGPQHLGGVGSPIPSLAAGLMRAVLPGLGPGTPVDVLNARLEHLALLAGLPVSGEPLDSMERGAVARRVAQFAGTADEPMLLLAEPDIEYLLGDSPSAWSPQERRRAAWLRQRGLLQGPTGEAPTMAEIEETLLRLALDLRVIERIEGRYRTLQDGSLFVDTGDEVGEFALESGLMTLRDVGGHLESATLALIPSDRVALFVHRGRLLAVVQEVDPDGAAFDRTSNLSTWTRFRSDRQLAELVEARYPGTGYRGFELGARGRSGRVGSIDLLGDDGSRTRVEGLAVRWTLDLPDTLFTAQRLEPPGGEAGWRFVGRGWGHGVGMCQVGAFGMAVRGRSYREILGHYYTGIEVSESGARRVETDRLPSR